MWVACVAQVSGWNRAWTLDSLRQLHAPDWFWYKGPNEGDIIIIIIIIIIILYRSPTIGKL